MYIRKIKFEERSGLCASDKSFKASITLKQVCPLVKKFTQSFATHTFNTRGGCRKFSRRIGPLPENQ